MDSIRVFLALVALLCMALFYARLGVRSALSPLCAVATVALGLSLFGALGFLWAGGLVLYLFALFCAGFLVFDVAVKKRALPRPGFGFWFFAVSGVVFILLLGAKQPLFTEWDEFSLWGVGQKLAVLDNQLYTTAPIGWTWTQTQKPAYIAFGYFFQFLGSGFLEWQAIAACDIFQLAMMASLLAPFDGVLRKHWNAAVPTALLALLLPYVFLHYQQAQSVSPAYLTTLVDVPLGLCFGAALACWFGVADEDKARLRTAVPVFAALALLTMLKDIGFSLALVAAVIVLADWLLVRRRSADAAEAPLKARGTKKVGAGWKGLAIRGAAALFAILVPFLLWERYTTSLSGGDRLESAVTTGGMGLLEMPAAFVRDLFSPDKSQRFLDVTSGMAHFFFSPSAKGNMLGAGIVIFLLCMGIVTAAAVVSCDKRFRRRCLCFGVLSTLGFAAYYLLITMTYLYLFRAEQAAYFDNYERYVYPAYMGWLMGSLVLLGSALTAQNASERGGVFAKTALVGAAGLVFALVGQMVPAAYTVVGVHPDEYNHRRVFDAHVDSLKPLLDAQGRTFLVKSGDLGIGWFMYSHQLLPWQLDYSYGGVMEVDDEDTGEKRAVTAAEWQVYLAESGCTTVYIDYADYYFIQDYGQVFSDGLQAYLDEETSLYAVHTEGNGRVTLEPLPMPGYIPLGIWDGH